MNFAIWFLLKSQVKTTAVTVPSYYQCLGPFKISEVLGKDRYRVSDLRGSERTNKKYSGVTCVENMKPWIKITDWINDDGEDVGENGM